VLRNENHDWLAEHKVNLLLQTGLEKNADLPNVPRMVDLGKTENDRKLLELFTASSVVGRAFAAPPGVPQERVDELRQAFNTMVKAPEFLADLNRMKLDFEPMSGADLQAFFLKTNYPPALIERAKEIAGHAKKR
jgi:tripartite-type tricarboxylate transporter receptor subunit TctC